MMTLDDLKIMFPVKSNTCGETGYIPMSFVNANLPAIADIVKEHKLRRLYRGPRRGRYNATTLRANAYAMVLYKKIRY